MLLSSGVGLGERVELDAPFFERRGRDATLMACSPDSALIARKPVLTARLLQLADECESGDLATLHGKECVFQVRGARLLTGKLHITSTHAISFQGTERDTFVSVGKKFTNVIL